MRNKRLSARRKTTVSAIGVILCLLFFIVSVEATFYEFWGKIVWKNRACKSVEAYLLNDELAGNSLDQNTAAPGVVVQKSFSKEYAVLGKRKINNENLLDKKATEKNLKELRRNFKDLIKKYRGRSVHVDTKGEFYINVNPEELGYLVILKKKGLFEQDRHLQFWFEKIYFRAGEVLKPQKQTFDESSVIEW